jgi:hypothetical protein
MQILNKVVVQHEEMQDSDGIEPNRRLRVKAQEQLSE